MKKRVLCFFVLLLINTYFIFSESNGSLKNRVGRMPEEWDSLVSMVERFRYHDWDGFVNLSNYMMGFAEAMYKDCEYLYDLYSDDWFYRNSQFYYQQYQDLRSHFGSKTLYFRSYYYNAGFSRVDEGADRFSFNDF